MFRIQCWWCGAVEYTSATMLNCSRCCTTLRNPLQDDSNGGLMPTVEELDKARDVWKESMKEEEWARILAASKLRK